MLNFVALSRAANACNTCSANRLVAPIKFVGRTALSVEMRTKFLTLNFSAACAETKVPWIIWAAWADRITFEEIEQKTGKTEGEVIKIMRHSIKPVSFRLWRKRVNQKSIKHRKKFEYSRKEITSKIKKNDYL